MKFNAMSQVPKTQSNSSTPNSITPPKPISAIENGTKASNTSNRKCLKCCLLVSLLVSIAGLIALIYVLLIYDKVIYTQISNKLILKPDNRDAMNRFASSEAADAQMSFYIFNISNLDEYTPSIIPFPRNLFHRKQSYSVSFFPKLQEIGPFVFDEIRYQKEVSSDQITITYRPTRKFVFNRKKSSGDLDSIAVIPNVPVFIAFDYLSSFPMSTLTTLALNELLIVEGETAFIKDTVGKLIFYGSHRSVFDPLKKVIDRFKIKSFEWPMKDDNFAFMYDRNVTWDPKYDGELTIGRGLKLEESKLTPKLDELMRLRARDGSPTLKYWNKSPETCNTLLGTTGTQYPPLPVGKMPEDKVYAYTNDLCRSLKFTRSGIVQSIKGVSTHEYQFNNDNLASGVVDNSCFCIDPNKTFCGQDGLLDMRTCILPLLYGSQSHFYGASKSILDQWPEMNSTQMRPTEKDRSKLYIEPKTGVTLMAEALFQINVLVPSVATKHSILNFARDKNPMLIPMFRMNESAVIGDKASSELRRSLSTISYLKIGIICGLFMCICAILVCAFLLIRHTYRSSGPPGGMNSLRSNSRSSMVSANERTPLTPASPKPSRRASRSSSPSPSGYSSRSPNSSKKTSMVKKNTSNLNRKRSKTPSPTRRSRMPQS